MVSAIEPRRVVEDGYDLLDGTYRAWVTTGLDGYRSSFLEEILRRVRSGAHILEIGCGPGTDAVALADERTYTGVDLSSVQLAHARRRVPAGTFVHGDVLETSFEPASFDAVVAFYVFGHVPRDRLDSLLERIHTWLRPDGLFAASFGTSDTQGSVERSWLGTADMFFSSFPPARTDRAIRDAGFAIERAETVTEEEEGEGPATFHWVIARSDPGGTPR